MFPHSHLACNRHYKLFETGTFYEFLLSDLMHHSPCIRAEDLSVEEINDTIHRILLDHPQLCHFEGQWRYSGGMICPIYTLSPEQPDRLYHTVQNLLPQFSSSDRHVEQIARWFWEHVTYDPAAPHGQSAYGALVEHRAVCKGIAKAFQLILRSLGIPCLLVEGSLDGQTKHVWNYCCVQGQWRHCDITLGYPRFAAQFGDGAGFLSLETQQIVRTHSITSFDPLPGETRFFHTLRKAKPRHAPNPQLPYRMLRRCSGIPQHIGTGSVSFVYKVTYQDKPAALKMIPCGMDLGKLYYATRECAMLDMVRDCPGIVPMLEYDVIRTSEDFTLFQLQEYMTPLDTYCLRRPMTARRALQLTRDYCMALAACLDAGVAHLDVQPGNLYVDAEGRGRLGDFSAALPVEELPGLRQLRGTPAYMAPEVEREQQYSQRSDIYSLGLVLYGLLTGGQLPQRSAFYLNLEPRLCRFLDRVCAVNPMERFPDFRSMQAALEELLRICGDIIPDTVWQEEAGREYCPQSSLCCTTVPQFNWEDQVTSKIPPTPAVTLCETVPM